MTHSRNDGNTAAKDYARTPALLFSKLNERFPFTIDIATDGTRDSLCPRFVDRNAPLNPEGFLKPTLHLQKDDIAYCNCPYGLDQNGHPQIPVWTKRCLDESRHSGSTIGMLLPADTSTISYHRDILGVDKDGNPTELGGASEIIWLWPRVIFNHPDGTPMHGTPKTGSMFVVFREDEWDGSPVNSSLRWK